MEILASKINGISNKAYNTCKNIESYTNEVSWFIKCRVKLDATKIFKIKKCFYEEELNPFTIMQL